MTTMTTTTAAVLATVPAHWTPLVRVSSAKMPTTCWGHYVHVAVMMVAPGYMPTQIRDTTRGRVVCVWRRCHDGTTSRSSSGRALAAARTLVASIQSSRSGT